MTIPTRPLNTGDTTMTTYIDRTVNDIGLAEIHEFLAANHRLGGDHFTPDMLRAWAADAEFQMSEGNPPRIEIRAADCVHGWTTEYEISNAGLDSREVEIDD